ncbi:MAG: glycosyltransferase family 9 protein [Desulfobulbaceae bacterium]|nr:glycosyltransferase family 9 protein [Desulfobulbaceae bacterium]
MGENRIKDNGGRSESLRNDELMRESLRKKFVLYSVGLRKKISPAPLVKSNKIIVIQLAALGDVCTLIPAVQSLGSTQLQVDVVCRAGLEAVWREFLPGATVFRLKQETWSEAEIRQEYPELLAQAYDAVFVTSISPFAAFLAALVRAGKRYGMIEDGRHYKGSRLVFDQVYNAPKNEHVCLRFENLFSLHVAVNARPLIATEGGHVSERYILIHPGAKWKPRRWPKEYYARLIDEISKIGLRSKVLVHESERDLMEYFQGKCNGKTAAICKTQGVADLLQAVKGCSLFIGNDSGPMHLANLYQKQTIVLWGPGNYERIRPLGENNTILIKDITCRPCRQYKDPERCEQGENMCLQTISVEEVLSVLEQKRKLVGL